MLGSKLVQAIGLVHISKVFYEVQKGVVLSQLLREVSRL